MKHVRVRITAGGREAEIHPMYDLLANAPFVERATALQWSYTGDALAMLHHVEGDADAFEAAVRDIPEVLGYELERAGEAAFYAYVRGATTESLREMFGPVARGAFVVVPPIVYHEDGTVSISSFGPEAEIQDAIERIPYPVEVDVEEVGGLAATRPVAESRLSDRQREAIEAALSLGYYDIPREAGHEAVAEAIGCAPSTAAEHVRKAESKLLRSVLGPG